MRQLGVRFSHDHQVVMFAHGKSLTVSFWQTGTSRLVLVEPLLEDALAAIVADYAGQTLGWGELRAILRDRGAPVGAVEDSNAKQPLAPRP